MKLAAKLGAYARLARLHKPAGWLLLLWPTLWAVWLAGSPPKPADVALFVAGVILTRGFGCCLNDIADRKLDAQVERTRMRPLAAGEISVWEAFAVAGVFLLACFALWLQLSTAARWWALGALAIAVSYPLAKRFVSLPQAHLGIAFSCGIPIAFAHATGSVPASAWLLVAANWFYVMAYDTIYAMVDRDDDLKAGARSSAIFFGKQDVLAVAVSYYLLLALLIAYAITTQATFALYLACAAGFVLAWHYIRTISSRERSKCFGAFRHNHWLGAVVWAGIAVPMLAV